MNLFPFQRNEKLLTGKNQFKFVVINELTHFFRICFEGNPNIPIYTNDSCAILAEEVVSILFEVPEDKIASQRTVLITFLLL